jgi:hypothetical protein
VDLKPVVGDSEPAFCPRRGTRAFFGEYRDFGGPRTVDRLRQRGIGDLSVPLCSPSINKRPAIIAMIFQKAVNRLLDQRHISLRDDVASSPSAVVSRDALVRP